MSVVVPTHNRPQLLGEALASLVSQNESRWEAIVVDDSSTPPVDVRQYGDLVAARTKVVRHPEGRGGPSAKNTGISHAAASVIAFLDDDDTYAPEYLARAVDVLQRNPGIDVLFMGVSWFGYRREAGERAYRAAMQGVLDRAQGGLLEADVIKFGRLVPLVLLVVLAKSSGAWARRTAAALVLVARELDARGRAQLGPRSREEPGLQGAGCGTAENVEGGAAGGRLPPEFSYVDRVSSAADVSSV